MYVYKKTNNRVKMYDNDETLKLSKFVGHTVPLYITVLTFMYFIIYLSTTLSNKDFYIQQENISVRCGQISIWL